PLFIMVTIGGILTLIRAAWVVFGFWTALSFDARVLGVCLLVILPGPWVLAFRSQAKIREKVASMINEELRGDIARVYIMEPFFAYFALFLAMEIAFLVLHLH